MSEGNAAAVAKRVGGRRSEVEEEIDDPKLKEFLQVMQPRAKSKLWSNDTAVDEKVNEKIGRGEKKREERRKGNEEKSVTMDVEEEEEDVEKEKEESDNVAKDNVVSDMDYFKSRVKKDWSDSESSDSDEEEEKEEEEEEENKDEEEAEVDEEEAGEEGVDEESDGRVLAQSDPASVSKDENGEMLDSSRLFVRNLPFTATEDELEEHFSKFGDAQVHLVIDKELNRSKGIAYVLYSQPESAQRYTLLCFKVHMSFFKFLWD